MLVNRFYARVRSDASLGPIFDTAIGDAWEAHLAKMCDFWASVALGAKRYKGNVQLAHMPLRGIEPAHFSRWLLLFLNTAEQLFEPAAAVRVMEPALRIAESLQLSRFGWNYQVPPEQKALLERVAPRRPGRDAPH
jgi:hemoglobin